MQKYGNIIPDNIEYFPQYGAPEITQNLAMATSCGFKSRLRHHKDQPLCRLVFIFPK
nr:MAG TPA: hypothetical protein [Caudoviricetes sp.]